MKIKILLLLISSVQCHDLLLEFLNIRENHSKIDFNLTKNCASSLSAIKNGINRNEIWAIKVQDASGASRPGFVWGNNFWLGCRRACNMLNEPLKVPLTFSTTRRMKHHITDIATKVPVEYRMFYATHTSPIQFDSDLDFDFVGLHVGLCFPKACLEPEIQKMAEVIFQSEIFKNSEIYGNVTFVESKTLKLRENFFESAPVQFLM